MGRPRITDKRICSNCGSDKTRSIRKGSPVWCKYKDSWLCTKCYCRLVLNPRRSKEIIKKYNDRNNKKILKFKDRYVLLKESPRKGVCTWCKAIRGKDCKITQIHHIEYHDDDILKDTVELCASCHGKESARLKRESRYRQPVKAGIFQ